LRIQKMKFGSVCSGIGAPELAWHRLGWESQFFSEIEDFPCAVLKHHYPKIENFGDMNHYAKWRRTNLDVLVGGTPCQSYSVAGLRAGLDSPNGQLALVFGAIAEKYRSRWLVWENVSGVLSSWSGDEPPSDLEQGRECSTTETNDFQSFLRMLVECGYGFAFRVLDAQYFGVPQRRRRVFVVGYLGDWRPAAAVLFERESLSGNIAPQRTTRKDHADGTSQGAHKTGFRMTSFGGYTEDETASAMKARDGKDATDLVLSFSENSRGEVRLDGGDGLRTSSISSSQSGKAGQGQPVILSERVRRLTPRECERLQGFPDDFTRIPYKGKPATDRLRYEALGNSMAVPVMQWIGSRIELVEEVMKEAS
jgi:DNA (cytosine-5)-methyltransferase 1